MIWRGWCFLAGLAPGALVALAWPEDRGALAFWSVQLAALLGGIALVVVASWLARVRDDDPARGPHLAAAASSGLAAVPAAAAVLLELQPPGWVWVLVLAAAMAVVVRRAARVRGPIGPGKQIAAAVGSLAAGVVVVTLVSGVVAVWGAPEPEGTESRAAAVYDIDARVATRPLPECASEVASQRVLAERGAHPRFGPGGAALWFDAPGPEGRRQIHRLGRESGQIVCWTCGQPGNNRRPSVGARGASLVFESDRHATWRHPTDTELYLASARGDAPPRATPRRLTFSPGPDDHAVLSPVASVVVWSRRTSGRYSVVSASIRSGHGGILLGAPGVVAAGGAAWAAPVGWSSDARSLLWASGNPFRPLEIVSLDLARGRSTPLARAAPGGASASFSADGGWAAVTGTVRDRAAGLLPSSLGFVLGPFATTAADSGPPLFRTTAVSVGEPTAALGPVELGSLADWGAPTGVALAPDGTSFVLAQRRAPLPGGGPSERLVEVRLACEPGEGGGSVASVEGRDSDAVAR